MKKTETAYIEYLEKSRQMPSIRDLIAVIQNSVEKIHRETLNEFEKICKKIDVKAFNIFLDEGRTKREINEAFLNYNIFSEFIKDESIIKEYENAVYAEAYASRKIRIDQDFNNAVRNYRELKEAYQHKYSDSEAYADYYEGKIIIEVLLQGFTIDTVEKVLEKELPNGRKDKSAYIKKILEECSRVKLIYQDIHNAPAIDNATNEVEAYQAAAKRFMNYNNLKVLNFEEEQILVKILLEDNFPREYIENALLKGSPVAAEPGRIPKEYIKSLLANISGGKTEDMLKKRQIELTAPDAYKDFLENIKKQIDVQSIDYRDNRRYYDCLAVKNLLEKDFTESEILEAISENNPHAYGDKQYLSWIYQVAQRLIEAEQGIITFCHSGIEINKNLTFSELAAEGITALNIFYAVVKEHYDLNPSIARRLHEPQIDVDTVETIKMRYPDIPAEILIGAIAKSPRGVLLSGIQSANAINHYPNMVMMKVEELIASTKNRNEFDQNNKQEFKNEEAIARQGLNVQDISVHSIGRSALKMLIKGHNPTTIKSTIIGLYDHPADVKVDVIDEIMERTTEVYRRLLHIINVDTFETPRAPEEYYINRFKDEYNKRHALKSSIDVIIAKELLARNYANKNIEDAINKLSPVIMEPGRNDNYLKKYVMPAAKIQYQEEKNKLSKYNLSLHDEIKDPNEEYKLFLEQIHTDIDLPHDLTMDRKIAEVMQLEGIPDSDIVKVIQQDSPSPDKSAFYAKGIINSLVLEMANDNEMQHKFPVKQRIRDYTEENS